MPDADEHGMVPREEWEQTAVHKASAYYCGKCGEQFGSPHEFYAHLDEKHPTRREPRRDRKRGLSGA